MGSRSLRMDWARHQPQRDCRRMLWIVVDGVFDGDMAAVRTQRFTGVGVDVEAWKIAAGNIHANAVALLEYVRGIKGPDEQLVNLPGHEQAAGRRFVPIARP